MAQLGDIVLKVRSKNAGPFWLTIDVFCGDADRYAQAAQRLDVAQVAGAFGLPSQQVQRYDMPDLHVIKFSLPRPSIQGAVDDRDMHGASWAALLAELEV